MMPAATNEALFGTPLPRQPALAGPVIWSMLRRLARGIAVAAVLMTSVCALYLAKSALGINLLAGPSPLHDLLYPLVR